MMVNSMEKEISRKKKYFKQRGWSSNKKCPLFGSNKFALPETMPGIEEPMWMTSRRQF
jgi:hypothetical protein